eukprot:gene30054-39913_t
MMSCPCGLTKGEVKDFDQRTGLERVPLLAGRCQNPLADGSEGVCGKALGAHPLSQVAGAGIGISPNSLYSKFWEAVQNPGGVIKLNSKWSLQENVSWIGGIKEMYVRDCYVQLADKLLADVTEPFHLALILGPKGIGKTMFLNYLIVRIVEKERAAQSLQTLSIVYLHSLSTTTDQGIRFTSQGVSINSDGAEYFLSDSLDICDGTLGNKLLLEVASESQGNYKNFSVRLCEKNGERIVMDVWSLAELEQVFGGRVRQVLGGISDAPEVLDSIETTARWFFGLALKEAFPKSWNRALQIIRNTIKDAQGKTSKEELAITTSLFWIVHGTGGTGHYSSTFLKLLAGQMRDVVEASLWNELTKLIGGSGEGLWFEAVGHMKLTQTNKTFSAKSLKKGGRKRLELNFHVPKFFIRTIDDIGTLPNNTYGLPIFGNFMLVDAILMPNIMLQFTVGETHGKADDIEKWGTIRSRLGGAMKDHRLVFVVPARNLATFSCIGVPDNLECYCMTWDDVANEAVLGGIKRKRK